MADKVTVTVTQEIEADELWSRIFGAEPWAFGSWWRGAKYGPDTDWDKAGTIAVALEDPEDEEGVVMKTLTVSDVAAALSKCPPHIVAEIMDDNADCVSADFVIQVAVLGECVYG